MNFSEDDRVKLAQIDLFLKNGTFTLRGVDVTAFLQCRMWLKDLIEKKEKPKAVSKKKTKKKKV